jgi:pantetheine-phosphate adenylyltransferase
MRIVLYPGSFDPVTYAHLDVAARASRLFDRVVMGVFDRPKKHLLFSTAERLALLQESIRDLPGVEAVSYSILTVEFARQIGACAMVRGLRTASDFEAEFVMAQVNQTIDPLIEAVILMSSQRFSHVSSSTVREMAAMGRDPVEFVPPHIIPALRQKFAQRG